MRRRQFKIIRHRVNRKADVLRLDPAWGAEVDIRSIRKKLISVHDPYKNGESFSSLVQSMGRRLKGPIILNPKEDGLESDIISLVKKAGIKDYFFLDLTIPTTVKLAMKRRIKNIAIRVSEVEPVEFALKFKNRVNWIWLDCFSGKPASKKTILKLRKHFRICLVSPEMEGYSPSRIRVFKKLKPLADAVCTKHPGLWA